jgi:hypothetical protein
MTTATHEEMLDVLRDMVDEDKRRGKGNGHAKSSGRFQLKPFDTIKLSTAPNYLVKGIIPRTGLVVVWGPPKCGKSFWAFDLTMHIALGWKYRDRRVQQGTVVYFALEGGGGFAARIEAWRRRHLADHHDAVPFNLLDVPIDLVADRDALIEAIHEQVTEPPAAVVIDTLNRALLGDENKSDDMAKFIRAADAIRVAFGSVVIIIHHCGVVKNRPRGHTSLAGADDAQIAVERDKDGIISAKVEHMKDAEAGAALASKLEKVDLGVDDDGDPMSSCIIVPSDAVVEAGPKLTKIQTLAYDALKRTIKDEGVEAKTDSEMAKRGVPVGTRACLAESWRQQFYNLHDAKKPATKRQALFRATLDLEAAKLLVLAGKGEYVYLLGQA